MSVDDVPHMSGQEAHQGKTELASSHISIPGQVHSVMMRVPSEGIQR